MKFRKLLLFIALILIFSLFACTKADPGPAGAAGTAGATGGAGAQGSAGSLGPKGDSGAANVIYSNWIPVTAASWKQDSLKIDSFTVYDYYPNSPAHAVTEIDSFIYFHVTIPTPKVTRAALDKGLVQFYIKDSTDYMKGVVNYFSGNLTAGVTDHRFLYDYFDGYGPFGTNSFQVSPPKYGLASDSMVLTTRWFGGSQVNDPYAFPTPKPALSDIVKYSELPPRTQFYIRYIVLPGGMPGGRQAGVEVRNYAAVKAYYYLPD